MAKLSATWGEVTVECFQLATDSDSKVVVSLAIAHQPPDSQIASPMDSQIASQILTSHLHLTVHPSAIAPDMAEQLQSVPLPFKYSQTVIDPSILHLLQLLKTEMQAPQLMNQMFVSSIVTVLTTHLLQNLQIDRCRQ
jgi:hypothetical protein